MTSSILVEGWAIGTIGVALVALTLHLVTYIRDPKYFSRNEFDRKWRRR